jgi:predicted nucleotidyltransferase
MKQTKAEIIRTLQELKPFLVSRGISSIALFGSFAKGEATPYSDVDVAIKRSSEYMQSYSAYDYFELIDTVKEKLRRKLHRNIDIFDMDSTSPFKEEIEKEMIYV